MKIAIPEVSLIALVGLSGSGKSTFAARHFLPTEVISSDFCRGLVSDDENDQAATNAAFEVLHFIAARRLEAGKLTVIDATNVQPEARKALVALAKEPPHPRCRDRSPRGPRRSAPSATRRGPTATSASTSCATSGASSAVR